MSANLTVVWTQPAAITVEFGSQQGLAGPPGTSLANGVSFEMVAPMDGAQTITLPYAATTGWCLLCINGLRQSVMAYSVSGSVLTLPAALDVLAGDLISFDYYPAL